MSPRRAACVLALALALACGASGCAAVKGVLGGGDTPAPLSGAPSGRDGWLLYGLGGLRFEAPEAWRASGSARRLLLEDAPGTSRLEVTTPEAPFETPAACLADAEVTLKKGEGLERSRRHPTTFAGAKALALEGDQAGWHVWAWVACDGRAQYRIFFTSKTPAPPPVLEALRTLQSTARLGGEV